MKNKKLTIVYGIIALLIIIGIYVYLNQNIASKKLNPQRDINLEQEFEGIIEQIRIEQAQKGTIFNVKRITVSNFSGKIEADITLNCSGEITYEVDKEIIESISNRLIAVYPDHFSENSLFDSDASIIGCSISGSNPTGIKTIYRPTTWEIYKGNFDSLV